MFERFTEDARQVVFEARSLAVARGDDRIGPLHLLSALTTVSSGGDSVAARVLAADGVDQAAVSRLLGAGPGSGLGSGLSAGSGRGAGSGAGSGAVPVADGDAEALASIGIDLDEIRRRVERTFGEGALDRIPPRRAGSPSLRGRTALTEDAKSTLAQALKEALALHHHYIGTEHLLLGLLRAAESAGWRGRGGSGLRQALSTLGLSYPAVRDQVLALLTTA
jgi:ATP-dependent Clp protease ATP-binding subunit ClpA